MYNALTVDVEDYFMVSAFADVVKFDNWHKYESRIEKNTRKILNLFDEHDVKGTFFTLGWVGEKYPALVKDIHSRGHEIASHGYNHRLIYDLTPDEFREDLRKSKKILEDLTGDTIKGYRAASYSVVKETLWALDILMEEGFTYDSSIFPVRHDRYGIPDAQRFPYVVSKNGSEIFEIPLTTYRAIGSNIPVAGGGYLRLFPMQLTKMFFRSINKREKKLFILYLHPWEIDPDQPRLAGKWTSVLRHYINLKTTLPKLDSLLAEFKFLPIRKLISDNRL